MTVSPEDTVSLREYVETLVKVQEKALDAHKLESAQERAEVKAAIEKMNGKLDTVLNQQAQSQGALALKDKLWLLAPTLVMAAAAVFQFFIR